MLFGLVLELFIGRRGYFFSYKHGSWNFQASFTHRCKHDVDNADLFTLYNEVRARVIIWDSVMIRIFTEPSKIFEHSGVKVVGFPFLRNDFYVLAVDEEVWYRVSLNTSDFGMRIFHNDSYYRINKVVNSTSFGYILDFSFGKNSRVYSKGYLWFDFLGDGTVWNWSRMVEIIKEHYLEFGFYVKGDGARLMIFIQNNLVREPAIEPFDQGYVNLFHVGLKAINEKFMF